MFLNEPTMRGKSPCFFSVPDTPFRCHPRFLHAHKQKPLGHQAQGLRALAF